MLLCWQTLSAKRVKVMYLHGVHKISNVISTSTSTGHTSSSAVHRSVWMNDQFICPVTETTANEHNCYVHVISYCFNKIKKLIL